MSDRFELFLTCPKGLEGLLIEEAVGLGLEEAREHTSAVRGMATMETAYRLCLWSRLANRVLLVLKRFPMKDAEDLYHGVLDIEWQDHMLNDGTLAVEFSGHGSGIDNTHFGALKVKDAIVDKLRTPQGDRPSIDKLNPDLRIHLRLDRGEAILSLDLSGHSLHQRGYRLQQGAAPLKENLAAAILIRSGWPRIAAEGGALADPMCGVGTFLVEAAMIAADMAPNLRREQWGFTAWLGHVPALWKKLHEEASERAAAGLAKPPLWIRGYEADPRLIQPGRNNVERAGLSEWIKIYQGEVGDVRAASGPEPERPGDLQPSVRRASGRRGEPALSLPEPRRTSASGLPELGGGGVHRRAGPGQAHGYPQPQAVFVLERRLAVQAAADQGTAGPVRHRRAPYPGAASGRA